MTVHNALLIDIQSNAVENIKCLFCTNRDRFVISLPAKEVIAIEIGQYYDVDFDIITDNLCNQFSFNFINPSKDNSHD